MKIIVLLTIDVLILVLTFKFSPILCVIFNGLVGFGIGAFSVALLSRRAVSDELGADLFHILDKKVKEGEDKEEEN